MSGATAARGLLAGGASTCRIAALVSAAVVLLAGCTGVVPSTPARQQVHVFEIGQPVAEPKWSGHAVYGLVEDTGQVARIALDEGKAVDVDRSEPLAELGENLIATNTVRHAVYVPQPKLGRVVRLDPQQLTTTATFEAGDAPSYLALDVGSRLLLALSDDGATVTPVRLRGLAALPSHHVYAGPEAELDAPVRGRPLDYFVAGPAGVAHYKGEPGALERTDAIMTKAHKSAGDVIKSSRLYVAEEGTDRLVAVEVTPGEDDLVTTATATLGEPVEHVATDAMRIYAATADKLVVLETNSYEGYENNSFSTVDTIDFRDAVANDALEDAPLSGIAVGENHVYLSFEDEPYLVSIAKPAI